MPGTLKLGNTTRALLFQLFLSSDHITPATGKTPTVTLSKNGGAFASPAGAVTEVASGWYKVAGNATDANTGGVLVLVATASGCDQSSDVYEVVAYDPDSSTSLGLSAVPIDQTVAISNTPTDGTIGAALLAAEAQGVGKWTLVGTTLTLYRKDGVTVVRTFTLDSATAPTNRT